MAERKGDRRTRQVSEAAREVPEQAGSDAGSWARAIARARRTQNRQTGTNNPGPTK